MLDKFEFIFALVALLLGLALTEIAGSLASALKARHRIRIGWITPLAALLICLDIVTMWPAFWALRNTLEVQSLTLIVAALLCLGYYVAASFVFPDSFENGMSLDDWYFANRWFSIGGTLALSATFSTIQLAVIPGPPVVDLGSFVARYWGWMLYIAQFLLALLTRRRWLIVADFGSILLMYFIYYVLRP